MKRREFIVALGGAAVWPNVLNAQQRGKARRIGVLFALAEEDKQAQARLRAFRGELQKLGWDDITIDARFVASNSKDVHRRYAQELVALQPDVLFAQNADSTAALLQETASIPIIFALVSDPVGSGFVTSFAKPGGNVTGFATGVPTMGAKWLELLLEIAPDVKRVLVPYNSAAADYFLGSLKATAQLLAIEASAVFVRDLSELEAVIAAHASKPFGGIISVPDALLTNNRLEVTSLVARYNLPAIYPFRFFAESGGLLTYGSDSLDNFRRAAIYADRILKGAKVGELPVQAPEKFELLINLQAAKSLKLTVPSQLLARADEVIE